MVVTKQNMKIFQLTYAALFLALALILPFLTGQIPSIGVMLCPMHLPVLLCGFSCGWLPGLIVGLIAPLLRSVMFGAPVMYPTAIAMAFELACYGALSGLLYRRLPKKAGFIYLSLIVTMVAGRIVSGLVNLTLLAMVGKTYTMQAFISVSVLKAVPGIILQIVVIPIAVLAMKKTGVIINKKIN